MSKLYRSEDDIILTGVFGGLGDYFQVNADILRVAYIIFAIFTGQVLLFALVYLAATLILPKKSELGASYTYSDYGGSFKDSRKYNETINSFSKAFNNIQSDGIIGKKMRKLLGYAFIVMGAVFALRKFLLVHIGNESFLAIGLIILGLFIIFKFDRKGGDV